MLEDKKNIIISLIKKEIEYFDFIGIYENSYGKFNLCNDLQIAYSQKDAKAVDLFLYLGSVISYEYQCIELLNNLLLETWHEKHEEIVRVLGFYKNEKSVDFLYKTALLELSYLEYDDDYVLADKCIRLLAKINNPEALDKLRELSESNNEKIGKSAIKQLNRLNN